MAGATTAATEAKAGRLQQASCREGRQSAQARPCFTHKQFLHFPERLHRQHTMVHQANEDAYYHLFSATANINRARRAVEDGQYRKAIQILSSAGIAPTSTNVFDIMLGKHPQAAPPPILQIGSATHVVCTLRTVDRTPPKSRSHMLPSIKQ